MTTRAEKLRTGMSASAFIFVLALVAFLLMPDAEQVERETRKQDVYRDYLRERTVARICQDGTKIYSWAGKLWTFGNKYPDLEVSAKLEEVCR